jgi:hypothetical protein
MPGWVAHHVWDLFRAGDSELVTGLLSGPHTLRAVEMDGWALVAPPGPLRLADASPPMPLRREPGPGARLTAPPAPPRAGGPGPASPGPAGCDDGRRRCPGPADDGGGDEARGTRVGQKAGPGRGAVACGVVRRRTPKAHEARAQAGGGPADGRELAGGARAASGPGGTDGCVCDGD